MHDVVRTLAWVCYDAKFGVTSYLLPPHVISLRDHPLEEGLRGFVANEHTVNPDILARCRNALPAGYPSPSRQHSPYHFMDSPRVKREPSTPVLLKQEAIASTEWTRPADLHASMRDSVLEGIPAISRKRPHEEVDGHADEPLPAKAHRLAEERDVAQARERALQAKAERISDLEHSLATYKSCTALTERRELRLAGLLDTVLGVPSSIRDPLDALEHHFAELQSKAHVATREATRARADLDARAAEMGFAEGSRLTLPVLLGALQQIAGIASASIPQGAAY